MEIYKKEGPRGQAPPGRPQGRQRFRNIPAGVYENAATGKVIVIISDAPQRTCSPEYYLGHIRIRNNKYKYASWRQGKKIKEKYLGTIWKPKVLDPYPHRERLLNRKCGRLFWANFNKNTQKLFLTGKASFLTKKMEFTNIHKKEWGYGKAW